MRYMLDTNMCIFAQKKEQRVLDMIGKHQADGLAISSITLAELEYGVEASVNKAKNRTSLIKFLSIIDILPFDSSAAAEYGRIRASLRSRGMLIGGMDMLIAAHALAAGLTVVTDNVREFERVDGLRIENWKKHIAFI